MIDYKIKIRLKSIDEVEQFINKTNLFHDDVNVHYGSQMFDGKSFMAMVSIELHKEIIVELISDNIDAQIDFHECLHQYKVGE